MSFLNIGQRSWFDIFVVLAAGLVSGSRWALSTCLVNERLWIFTSSIYLENTVSVRCLLETTKLHSIWFREKSSLLHSLWVTQSVVHKTEKPILGDRIRSEGKITKQDWSYVFHQCWILFMATYYSIHLIKEIGYHFYHQLFLLPRDMCKEDGGRADSLAHT